MSAAAGYGLRDLWTGATSTTSGTISATVAAHGTAVYRLSGGAQFAARQLVGQASGQCLDVHENIVVNDAAVEIFPCNGGPNQRWNVTAAGELRVYDGTRCLDVFNGETAPGPPCSSGSATAAPTSSSASTPTARSPPSSPASASTSTARPRRPARASSSGPVTASPTRNGPDR
jgi:hypothetical protein